MFWIIMSSLLGGIIGSAFLVYTIRKGQFEDAEDVKYQMFHEDNEKE